MQGGRADCYRFVIPAPAVYVPRGSAQAAQRKTETVHFIFARAVVRLPVPVSWQSDAHVQGQAMCRLFVCAISQFSVMNLLFWQAGKGIGRIRRDDVGIVPYGSPGGTAGACCLARPAAFALNLNGTQNAREEHTDSCVGADAHIGPITFPDPSAAQGAVRSARRLAGKGILFGSRTVGGFRFQCHREERSDAAISQRCRLSCCFLPASD